MVFSKVRESQEKSGNSSGGQGENPCLKFESQGISNLREIKTRF